MDKLAQTQLKWTDKLPIDWRVEKGKHLFDKVERSLIGDEEIITVFRDGTVTLRKNIRTEGFTNAIQEHGYQRIERGDLVIHSMDAFAGAIGISDSTGKGSPVYNVCLPKRGVVTEYYAFVLREIAHKGYLKAIAKGIRERSTDFNFKSFSTLLLPVPPVQEQQAIVRFLDQKLAKIDEYIRKKERMIELLKEQKTSLINEAITQGLDPDVPKKDSGIDWLGKIPEHWDISSIKYLVEKGRKSIKPGPFGTQLNSNDFTETGYKVYNQRTVYDENFEQNDFFVSEQKFRKLKSFEVEAGDLLITSRGTIGKCTIVPNNIHQGILHPCLIKVRINEKLINKDYFWWYVNFSTFFIESLKLNSNSTTIDVIYSETLKKLKIPVPPINEQKPIINILKRKTKKIESIIEKEKIKIKLFKEYRQSLISEAVTGKIDCREYMPEQTANADV